MGKSKGRHNDIAPEVLVDKPEVAAVADASVVIRPDAASVSVVAGVPEADTDGTVAQLNEVNARDAARNVKRLREALLKELPPEEFARKLVALMDGPQTAQIAVKVYVDYVGMPVLEKTTRETRTSLSVRANAGSGFSPADVAAAKAIWSKGLTLPTGEESSPPAAE
jgi:hypothetical protein